ncbi:class I SAM-dependent methyltransferase [Arthrobacter sp. H14]|uniref:class I SAM-dependent methyltransferase n=1 Tax=Arthrobacter sp. H14 TaxID=1312959 RepID=UPI00047CF8B0|nr:methyltransferase domain-containing protein [Arthrobacter sp. H14]
MLEKYSTFAPFYDLLSGEYPVYRAGRVVGIEALGLSAGDQVLDVGCGTGLNFPHLEQRVGAAGTIVGIDKSADMLRQARRRADKHGWTNVILLQADAATPAPEEIAARIEAQEGRLRSDAAIATYALSLIPDWPQAWKNMQTLCRDRAAQTVVDMQEPVGTAAVFTPLARFACWLGGADISAHPWSGVEQDCAEVTAASARGGHLQIRTGRTKAGTPPS